MTLPVWRVRFIDGESYLYTGWFNQNNDGSIWFGQKGDENVCTIAAGQWRQVTLVVVAEDGTETYPIDPPTRNVPASTPEDRYTGPSLI